MESDTPQRIREAINAQDYATALHAWNGYVKQLRESVGDGDFPAERMAELNELFHWGRRALLCARSQCLDRLNAIHVAAAYTTANRT